MQYFISFMEGILTFISPCLLPMLPVYISYFAGGQSDSKKTLCNALGFILGFTLLFTAMGAMAGTLGSFLSKYQTAVNIISGLIVAFFGLNFMGLIKLNLFKGSARMQVGQLGFFSSVLFGVIFSVGWTPCVGAFLGSALMLASQQGHVLEGTLMLLSYSLGLGIPFFLSAILLDQLKATFNFIKQHYTLINRICGVLLVLIGILMATGVLNTVLRSLS